jgi:colanic acid biosynthesis glycosyl transferase WcaI
VTAASRERRRLLLITHRPLEFGGPGSVRWRFLIGALEGHGWETKVVSARTNPTQDALAESPGAARLAQLRAQAMGGVGRVSRRGFNALGVQPEALAPQLVWTVTGRRAIRARLDAHRPHAVVATVPPVAAMFAAAGLLGPKDPPLVVDMRDNWAGHPSYDAGGSTLTKLEGRALAKAEAVVTVTDRMAELLRLIHPESAAKVRLMPNGFDPALLERRSPPRAAWPEKVTLIHPGVLYGDRRVDELLEALARPSLAGRVRLELVGNLTGETERALAAAPPGVEVETVPPQSWDATMDRVAAADVVAVVYPRSMGDELSLPVKLYEALALGKPVLSITAGGASEALLRELGQDHALARHGDAASVGDALERLLGGPPPAPVDPARIARFDRARVAADYAALLDELARG